MKQREMAVLGELMPPEEVPRELITRCANMLQAVKLCIQYSHHSYESVREYLRMDSGNFSRMMNGTVNLPLNKIPELMRFCMNIATLQYLANEMGYKLVPMENVNRIKELEAEINQLKLKESA